MPWFRKDNPYDPPEPLPPKPIPATMVRVICEGCNKPIDIRVRKKDNGRKTISCHNCLQVIEVDVNNKKDIKVYTQKQNGSNRRRMEYEKIWQEE
jgi:transcription elongation factor Elf1